MSTRFSQAVLVAGILATSGWSQGLPDQLNFSQSHSEGFHLYGVSTFFSGSTYNFLSSAGSQAASVPAGQTPNLQRAQYGAGATLGWQHFRSRSRLGISARYSGSYNGTTAASSSFNSLNHSGVINIDRSFGEKWNLSISASGQDVSLSQSLFEPTFLGGISQSASSFDDLAASLSVGRFSSTQNGAILNGAGAYSTTLGALLGSRILSYSLNSSVSYEASSRLRFQFGSFAIGGQRRVDNASEGIQNNYVVPKTLGGVASAAFSYSLSPRTDVGVSVAQTYSSSRYQKAYGTSATASFGRKMGKDWFVRAFGGSSFTEKADQSTGRPPAQQLVWGGSIGYKTHSNTFTGLYNRSGYDSASAALGTNTTYSGAWSWRHPRSGWGFNASYLRHETLNTGFSNLSGWQGNGGISHSLPGNLSLFIAGSYLRSQGTFVDSQTSTVNVRAIRVSLSWAPRVARTGSSAADEDPGEIK